MFVVGKIDHAGTGKSRYGFLPIHPCWVLPFPKAVSPLDLIDLPGLPRLSRRALHLRFTQPSAHHATMVRLEVEHYRNSGTIIRRPCCPEWELAFRAFDSASCHACRELWKNITAQCWTTRHELD